MRVSDCTHVESLYPDAFLLDTPTGSRENNTIYTAWPNQDAVQPVHIN